MKKRILLFSSSIILLAALITAYSAGPVTGGLGNRTGSKASIANCSTGGGCHATNSTSTLVTLILLNSTTNVPVTSWEPGGYYKLKLSVGSLTKAKFGFQVSAVHGLGAAQQQAGTFSIPPDSSAIKMSNGLQIWEHTLLRIIYNGVTNIDIYWTAPTDTTIDSVKFYAIGNAVDFNGASSGDQPNAIMMPYARAGSASVATLNADIKIAAYPNPVTDKLNISLENADNGTYTIRVFDMNGKVVANQTANVNKSYSTSINAAAWANGMYHVQLQKDGAKRTIAVIKQ